MDYTWAKQEVTRFCHYIYEKGYTQGSGGNVSCRVPGTDLFAIKRTAVNMKLMTPDDVVIVDGDLNVVDGDGKPSKEAGFHIGVLKTRPEMKGFIHCHPNYAIAFANNDLELPMVTVTCRKALGKVPVVESALAGSDELRDYVVKGFTDHPHCNAILMKEHGVSVVGTSLEHAFNLLDILEQTAKQAYLQVMIKQNLGAFQELLNK